MPPRVPRRLIVAALLPLVAGCRDDAPSPDDASADVTTRAPSTAGAAPLPAPAAPRNTPGDPARRDELFRQAERFAAFHDDARAIRKLEKAIAVGPEDARCRRLLGLVRLRKDSDVDAARVELRRAAALDPTDPEPHLMLASLALEMGDAATAAAYVADALRRDPDHVPARVVEARLLAQAGDDAAAAAKLDALVATGHAPAGAYFERGKVRLRAGDAAGALVDFEAALRRAPTDTRIRFNLARALRELGRVEDAVRAQEEFELLRPVFSLASHDKEPDPRARLVRLREICERFPGLWPAWVERARTEMGVDGPARARATLERARDAFPEVEQIRELLAVLLDQLGDADGAAREREAFRRLKAEGES